MDLLSKAAPRTATPPPAKRGAALPEGLEAAAVWVPVSELKPWADNPRKNDKAIAKVVESIKRFGFGAPILARKADGEIIAGHTRLKAAAELGLDRVPVRYLDLDPADAHLLAIADNRVGEEADWDDEKLAEILQGLKDDGLDLADTGFSDGEIHKILAEKGDNDVEEEWVGMPECSSVDQTAWGSVKVNFANAEGMRAFAQLIGQTVTESTKSVWFPKAEIGRYADKAYESEPEAPAVHSFKG